ncbi:MAG: hypothetical protein WCV84_03890 [Patescibacteria group bacterium]
MSMIASVWAHLKEGWQKLEGLETLAQGQNGGRRCLYRGFTAETIPGNANHAYIAVSSKEDLPPTEIVAFFSLKAFVPLEPERKVGKYVLPDKSEAHGVLDWSYKGDQKVFLARADSYEDLMSLYKLVRTGKLAPAESYEEVQIQVVPVPVS